MNRITLFSVIFLGLLAAFGFAANLRLPPNLELVSQDSSYITVRDKETGLIRMLYCPGESKNGPGWEMASGSILNPAAATFDTCFSFDKIARVPQNMGALLFGDADGDSLTEIAGLWGGNEYIYERSPFDTIYEFRAIIPHGYGMDYAGDADGDGRREMMSSQTNGMVLFEAPDSGGLPTDSVFAWPWPLAVEEIRYGGFTDLNGDGRQEISFRPNLMQITALRNTADNQYELDYVIPMPESLRDNYYDYIWGDLDGDGRSEVVTTGSRGRILCFENTDPDSFPLVWVGQVRERNTDWIVGPSDIDGDGIPEFFVMCVSDHASGYFFYAFEALGDNLFHQTWCDSLPGNVWEGGSLGLLDFDGDGRKEILVCSNWWTAIYGATENDAYAMKYLRRDPGSEAYVFDTDRDGLGEIVERAISGGVDILEFTPGSFYRADVNSDCQINFMDVTYLVNYFRGRDYPLPEDRYKADINGNCEVNGIDVTYLVNYFKEGTPPIDRDCAR